MPLERSEKGMKIFMIIGYIKQEKIESGFFQKILGIEIKKFDNNYIIAISNKNKIKILAKYIEKLNIVTLVFSKELDNSFKDEICLLLSKKNVNVLNGKKLMQYMDFEIVKYILNKQNATMKQEDIYIVFKKEQNLDLNFLKRFIENFKTTNIVTNDIERLKNVQENLLENDGILIAVANNKKKALKRAKYKLNVNLNKQELNKYQINRNAIVINIRENVKQDPALNIYPYYLVKEFYFLLFLTVVMVFPLTYYHQQHCILF